MKICNKFDRVLYLVFLSYLFRLNGVKIFIRLRNNFFPNDEVKSHVFEMVNLPPIYLYSFTNNYHAINFVKQVVGFVLFRDDVKTQVFETLPFYVFSWSNFDIMFRRGPYAFFSWYSSFLYYCAVYHVFRVTLPRFQTLQYVRLL